MQPLVMMPVWRNCGSIILLPQFPRCILLLTCEDHIGYSEAISFYFPLCGDDSLGGACCLMQNVTHHVICLSNAHSSYARVVSMWGTVGCIYSVCKCGMLCLAQRCSFDWELPFLARSVLWCDLTSEVFLKCAVALCWHCVCTAFSWAFLSVSASDRQSVNSSIICLPIKNKTLMFELAHTDRQDFLADLLIVCRDLKVP